MFFGIEPPAGARPRARWGARAIYRDFTFDMLWDRTSCEGEEPDRAALLAWVEECGLPGLRAVAKRARLPQSSREELEVVGMGFRLVASPRRSYGYLYIGAWPLPREGSGAPESRA
jgi:hypothetical protein